MSVEELMKSHGFSIAASCAGIATYTKWVTYKGKRAYVTVTDVSGDGVPMTVDEPVQVRSYDMRSGDELEASQDSRSLSTYLESLNE